MTEFNSAEATPRKWMKKLRLPKSNDGKKCFGKPVTSAGAHSALTRMR